MKADGDVQGVSCSAAISLHGMSFCLSSEREVCVSQNRKCRMSGVEGRRSLDIEEAQHAGMIGAVADYAFQVHSSFL